MMPEGVGGGGGVMGGPAAGTGFMPFVAFQKSGLTVTFACVKPQLGNPALTMVTATYINNNPAPVTDFVLQVLAVP